MTTMTNAQVVGELGWTAQLLADVNGGRIPTMWRPPYGDVDNRVRAIATHVFGLRTVLWNQDTSDWRLTTTPANQPAVSAVLATWANGPKSPGLLVLEHELSDAAVGAFVNSYAGFKSAGWAMGDVAGLLGMRWYQNSATNDNVGSVDVRAIAGGDSPTASLGVVSMNSTSSMSSATRTSTTTTMMMSTSTAAAVSTTIPVAVVSPTSRPSASASTSGAHRAFAVLDVKVVVVGMTLLVVPIMLL